MTKKTLVLTLVLLTAAVTAVAAPDYYATKADERAGKLTPGTPAGSRPGSPDAGGDTCATPTAIAATPFSDTGDTTGAGNDNASLPAGCSTYTTTNGPDHIYVFTAAAGAMLQFVVTPTTATYDTSIYVLGTCGTSSTCIIGSDNGIANEAETLATQAYALGTHAVYIDSFYAQGAACTGQGSILCGNGAYAFGATGALPVELMSITID